LSQFASSVIVIMSQRRNRNATDISTQVDEEAFNVLNVVPEVTNVGDNVASGSGGDDNEDVGQQLPHNPPSDPPTNPNPTPNPNTNTIGLANPVVHVATNANFPPVLISCQPRML
jgi:hypothetical protein